MLTVNLVAKDMTLRSPSYAFIKTTIHRETGVEDGGQVQLG